MKIISHGYRPGEGVQIVAKHGIWPACWFRIYYGHGDHWYWRSNLVEHYATGNIRARLTAHYWRHYNEGV